MYEMNVLCKLAGLSRRERLRNSVVQEGFRLKPLLLHMERSQMMWFMHLIRMLSECLLGVLGISYGEKVTGYAEEVVSPIWSGNTSVSWDKVKKVAGEREIRAPD